MRKPSIFLFLIFIGNTVFANHGTQALGELIPFFILAIGIAVISVINFFYCIYNINKKSKTIRIWNFILLIPASRLTVGLLYFSPLAGFVACFIILLKGVFIYLSFPNK